MGAKDLLTKRLEEIKKKGFENVSKRKLKNIYSDVAYSRQVERHSLGMDENMSDDVYDKHIKHLQAAKKDHDILGSSGMFSANEMAKMRAQLAAQEQELANLRAGRASPTNNQNQSSTTFGTDSYDESARRAQEEQERQEEIRQQTEEEKQKIEEEKRSRIERLKQKRDEALERIKNGPPAGIMIIAKIAFVGLWIMDTIVGLIPFVGDALAAGISFIVWAVLCILLVGDLATVGKIIAFLFIDFIVGFIPGIGDMLDPGVELVALFIKKTPFHMFKKAYQERIPRLAQQKRAVYDEKIKLVEKEEDTKFKQFKAGLQGHFIGLAVDNRKIVFLILFVLIAILGPMGIGWLAF